MFGVILIVRMPNSVVRESDCLPLTMACVSSV